MLKKIIFPDFLAKLDRRLLLSSPLLWSSRLHHVAWFTLLAALFIAGVSMILPLRILSYDFIGFYWMMVSLIMIAGLIIWFVYLFRHNNTKQYGNRTLGREWLNLLYHYCSLVLISSVIFILPFVFLWRAHHKIEQSNLVEKVNILNVNSGFFPENEYSIRSFYESDDSMQTGVVLYGASAQMYYGNYTYRTLNKKLFDYDTISARFYRISGKAEIKTAIAQYLDVAKKEGITHSYSVDEIAALYDDTLGYQPSGNFEVANMQFNSQIKDVIDQPFDAFDYFGFVFEKLFFNVWLLIFLPILLLAISMFRNLSLKFFLIAIGVTIVLVIINAVILGITLDDSSNLTPYIVLPVFFIGWALFLLVVSIRIFSAKYYSAIEAYCLFLFNILLPLLPFVLTVCYVEYQIYEFRHNNTLEEHWIYYTRYTFYNSAHIATLLVFVLLQQLYFKPLYERLWALPKK
ncbi:MAG: hypothetical protein V4613_03385 [Bacteroidota bacterium]